MFITELMKSSFNTLYFNYKVFGIAKMFKFKALIGPNVRFGVLSRRSVICEQERFGSLRIGLRKGSFNRGGDMHSFIKLEKCRLVIRGKATMAQGIVLNLAENSTMILGDGFSTNYGCLISIADRLECENNVRLGWDVSIMDADGHTIKSKENEEKINLNRPIIIRENVWLAAKSTIMKGVSLAKNVIVPYGSIITKSNDRENCIFGGTPNRILKENVYRDYECEKNL